ncbi:MAG TPA: hypothetical protein VMB34_14325 [Acetobacteraceae bacterium]|nr:hypothetical protein [Acetobacteraceae bacterium]
MATAQNATRGICHAAIRATEPAVFRAEYRDEMNPDNPDEREVSRRSRRHERNGRENLD